LCGIILVPATVGWVAAWREDFRKYIARSDLPAMIIHDDDDDDDHSLPADVTSRRQAKLLKGVEVIEIKGAFSACLGRMRRRLTMKLWSSFRRPQDVRFSKSANNHGKVIWFARRRQFGAAQIGMAAAQFLPVPVCLQGSRISYLTRYENEKGTNPEELIATAHAGCFAMTTAFILQVAAYMLTEIEVEAAVTIEPEGEGFRISRSALTLRAQVPNLDQAAFAQNGQWRREELPGFQDP
jgi:OsmC subfamily peroxiredoxin